MRTKFLTFTAATLLSSLSFAQQGGIISDPDRIVPQASSVPNPNNMVPMPEEAKIKYGIGNAPFYVNLKSYVYRAESALRRDQSTLSISESDALGVSQSDFEQLISMLSFYREREKEDWQSHTTAACAPYLAGGSIDNEYALQAIAEFDNSDPRREVLVEEVMNEVATKFDQPLVDRLRERINEHGETVEYEKIDLIKYIEHSDGLEAGVYLKAQCDVL